MLAQPLELLGYHLSCCTLLCCCYTVVCRGSDILWEEQLDRSDAGLSVRVRECGMSEAAACAGDCRGCGQLAGLCGCPVLQHAVRMTTSCG